MNAEAIKEKRAKRLKTILRQIAGKVSEKDDELIPPVIIKGKGEILCYSPTKKSFIKIYRGTKAYIVDDTIDKNGRILIYTNSNHYVAIEKEEIEEIGFN
jgi:hypothetical protein